MTRRTREYTEWPQSSHTSDTRIRVNEHLSALDYHFNPIPGVFAIGDDAMPVSGRLPATAQGELRSVDCP